MTSLSSEAVDQVCQMNDEEFRSVLEQLAHHKPQGDLVKGMCAEAAKDDVPVRPAPSHPSSWSMTGQQSLRKNSRSTALRSDHSQQKKQQQQGSDQNGLNSQSMQDLVSMEYKSTGGKNSRKGNKMRANSFTQEDSGKGGTGSKSRNRCTVTPVPSSVSSEFLTSRKVHTKTQSSAGNSGSTYPQSLATTTAGTSTANSSATSPADPSATHSSSSSNGIKLTTNSSNNNVNTRDCDVQSGRIDASARLSSQSSDSNPCHSSSSISNHNSASSEAAGGSGSRLLAAGPQPVRVCREEHVHEVMDNMVEMCDLRQRANLVNYSNSGNSTSGRQSHDVDSLIPFQRLESQDAVDTQFAERRSLNQESSSSHARNGESSDDRAASLSAAVFPFFVSWINNCLLLLVPLSHASHS